MVHRLAGLSILLAGCTVEVPGLPLPRLDHGPEPAVDARHTPRSEAGGTTVSQKTDLAAKAPAACPALAGSWGGSCAGKLSGLTTVEVTGSISITLKPDVKPGDFVISAGEWTSASKTSPSSKTTQPLVGVVRCGVFQAPVQITLYGVKASGTLACVFDETGCAGTWSGKATAGTGSGTFELRRK